MKETVKEEIKKEIKNEKSQEVVSNLNDFLAESVDNVNNFQLKGDVLETIPVFSTALKIYKTGKSIIDIHNYNKLIDFLNKLNEGVINTKVLDEYKEFLLSDSNAAEKELGRIIILLNKTTELEQVPVLANLYKAYIFGNYTWDVFRQLSFANQNLFTSDYDFIHKLKEKEIESKELNDLQKVNAERLTATGLISSTVSSGLWSQETIALDSSTYRLTYLGELFELYSQDNSYNKKLNERLGYKK